MKPSKPRRLRDRRKSAVRAPLTKERALEAAVALADAQGLEGLTMRRLASALGVEAMSLYHHLPGKDAVLDGMVDLVFAEVELPVVGGAWREVMRARMSSMRAALVRHPWALRILESRATPGALTLAHHDAMLGCLRAAGFPLELAGHAYSVLDSYLYGFVHTEVTLPFRGEAETFEVARGIFERLPPGAFPHLVEFAQGRVLQPGYDYADEFPVGLELILEGLERRLEESRSAEACATPTGLPSAK